VKRAPEERRSAEAVPVLWVVTPLRGSLLHTFIKSAAHEPEIIIEQASL